MLHMRAVIKHPVLQSRAHELLQRVPDRTGRGVPLDRGARPLGGLLAARGAQDEVETLLVGDEKLDQFRVVELVEREMHVAVQLVGALEAEATIDLAVALPHEVGDFVVAPRARRHELRHRWPPFAHSQQSVTPLRVGPHEALVNRNVPLRCDHGVERPRWPSCTISPGERTGRKP